MPASPHSMPVLTVATGNAGKLREIRACLEGLLLEVRSLSDFDPLPEPVEDQPTFEGNARLKARYYAEKLRTWVLADDSGIEVDALGGAPGVHSARYAGAHGDDEANNRKLLDELKDVKDGKRTARFRCVLCLSGADLPGGEATFEGVIEGEILREPVGEGGFGYDPLFFHPPIGKSTAQIPMDEKNKISHRGKALQKLRAHLSKVLPA